MPRSPEEQGPQYYSPADMNIRYGLGEAPTDTEVELVVTGLWERGAKVEAMELVLGRHISAQDIDADPSLAKAFMQPDFNDALGMMRLSRDMESVHGSFLENPPA